VETKVKGEVVWRDYYKDLSQASVSSANDLVVLFVSSEPIDDPVRKIAFKNKDGELVFRYLLPVPRTTYSGLAPEFSGNGKMKDPRWERAVDKWQQLFEAILDRTVLDSWFENPGNKGVSKILNEIFSEPASIEFLAALSMLCQGFLAACAEKKEGKWEPAEIRDTLLQTGFPAYVDSGAPGVDVLISNLRSKRDRVSNPSWWSAIFAGNQAEVEVEIAREWGAMDFKDCPEKLKNLLDAMYGADPITPKLVADAYSTIIERLKCK
jgi:hypothetical protein